MNPMVFAVAGMERHEKRRRDYMRLTTCQESFLSDPSPIAIWRDGNQIGKSTALAFDVIERCRGTHPFIKTHRPPIRALVISVSLEQMAPLMEKIWELTPKDEIDERCGYDPGRGITGKPPRLVFTSGPGKGSTISFATYRQGSTRIAGGTYHIVICDEPPPEEMFGEVMPRVMKERGHIRVGLTPTPDMPDQGWLRTMVEKDQVSEHNYGLEEAHCWPKGNPKPWITQEEINQYEKGLLEIEREMRMRGAWEALITGRWLQSYSDDLISNERPPKGSFLSVGIDYGFGGRDQQAMALVAIANRGSDRPRIYVMDCIVEEGFSTPEADADALLTMLRRNGLRYQDVDEWVGDRPTGSHKFELRKSNKDLRREISKLLGLTFSQTKFIWIPKKFSGSMVYGMRLLNTLMERKDVVISPRASDFSDACKVFAGDKRDPAKDVIDAVRYSIERAVKHKLTANMLVRY